MMLARLPGGRVVEMMRAVRIHSFGGPQMLRIDEVPRPLPREDEILLQVKATSVNPVDYKIRSGEYAKPEQLPITLGRDVSGTVALCGTKVRDWERGDDVIALLPPGRGASTWYSISSAGKHRNGPGQF